MKNLRKPYWIFLINTLPILLLIFLYLGEFTIIKSLLEDEHIRHWKIFSFTIIGIGLFNILYALYAIFTKREISVLYGVVSLICHISFIYTSTYHSENMIPFNIPQWMLSDNSTLYVGTFLMPSLAYSLFILVTHFTPKYKKQYAWKNLLIAIAVPISYYIFFLVIQPLWQPISHNYSIHVFTIFAIISVLVFLFFLTRALFILVQRNNALWTTYELIWKIPLCILLPLMGLLVNNGLLFNDFSSNNYGVFGNFNSIWFYSIALLNGVLLCLPNGKNKIYRLLLFVARCITLAYTFYFFIVFLPFLPLSIFAIIALGSGFLMLAPLILFIIHIKELFRDFDFLQSIVSKKILRMISFLGFLVLPIALTIIYLNDKNVLTKTLEYIYSPDYSKSCNIDNESLKNTLSIIKKYKDGRNSSFFTGTQTPYLSTYFKWLVLDNLTLSYSKIRTIEQVFFDEVTTENRNRIMPRENIRNTTVSITNISSESTYNETDNSWTSWIDLEITNASDFTRSMEYATTIELPTGCWISDYYLNVNSKKEMGILAEKKSALWVFSQIRNENRDPGILYYLAGNKVAFRVFPFLQNEVRKTGIQFIHKEPVTIIIDGHALSLGEKTTFSKPAGFQNKHAIYVSANTKKTLKTVQRKPYFHFIVDVSKNKKHYEAIFIKKIEALKKIHPALYSEAKISFTNSNTSTYSLNNSWKDNYQSQQYKGGFYLDRAIKKALIHSYQNIKKTYPILIVVTDSIENAIIPANFLDYEITFPESDNFYVLKENNLLEAHSLIDNPLKKINKQEPLNFTKTTRAYEQNGKTIAYLPNNNTASIVIKENPFDAPDPIKEKTWESGLTLQTMWTAQVLQPKSENTAWLKMIKYSFISKIMTPVTSYLVVENEAQKAILKKKQEQVLSGNKNLDLDEDAAQMSEPSMCILVVLFGVFLFFRRRKESDFIKK